MEGRTLLERTLAAKRLEWPVHELYSENALYLTTIAERIGPLMAKEAGRIMAKAAKGVLEIHTKVDKTFVTQYDVEIEKKMYELIFAEPDMQGTYLYGEEDVASSYKEMSECNKDKTPFVWVIDSIEATSDFIRTHREEKDSLGCPTGEGVYAFQAALLYKGYPLYAVTYMPVKDVMQESSIRFGTRVNGASFNVSTPTIEELRNATAIVVKYQEDSGYKAKAAELFTVVTEKNASETAAAWDILTRKARNIGILINPRAYIYDSAAPGFHVFMGGGDVRRFDGSPLFPYTIAELSKEVGNIPYAQVAPGFSAYADILLYEQVPQEAKELWRKNVAEGGIEAFSARLALERKS